LAEIATEHDIRPMKAAIEPRIDASEANA